MIVLFASALLVAFVALVLASQLPAPMWLWALDAVALGLAVAAYSGLAVVLARLSVAQRWAALRLPLVSAAIALMTYSSMLEWISPQGAVARIDFWELQLAALAVVGGTFALVSGVAALGRSDRWYHVVVAGVAVTVSLFVMGPLMIEAGIPVDWRAFLGLAGLGVGAFAVVEAARKVRTQ